MTTPESEPWYGAKCLFRHQEPGHGARFLYEERIILIRSDGPDDAMRQGEEEAEKYAAENDAEYLGSINVYHLFDDAVGPGTEVFSLMRSSDKPADDFVDHYFSDGTEHAEDVSDDDANDRIS